jgi:hypothetical protein
MKSTNGKAARDIGLQDEVKPSKSFWDDVTPEARAIFDYILRQYPAQPAPLSSVAVCKAWIMRARPTDMERFQMWERVQIDADDRTWSLDTTAGGDCLSLLTLGRKFPHNPMVSKILHKSARGWYQEGVKFTKDTGRYPLEPTDPSADETSGIKGNEPLPAASQLPDICRSEESTDEECSPPASDSHKGILVGSRQPESARKPRWTISRCIKWLSAFTLAEAGKEDPRLGQVESDAEDQHWLVGGIPRGDTKDLVKWITGRTSEDDLKRLREAAQKWFRDQPNTARHHIPNSNPGAFTAAPLLADSLENPPEHTIAGPSSKLSVAQTLSPNQTVDLVCDLLGIWQAWMLFEDVFPEDWARHPEMASAEVRTKNRRWFLDGNRRGDVVDAAMLVLKEPDRIAAAERVLKALDEYPDRGGNLFRPEFKECPAAAPDNGKKKSGLTESGHSSAPLPKIERGRDFVSADLPQPLELVDGVLHQGSKMVLGSSSKSYKTWVLLDLALSVAGGTTWLGFPTRKARALYINLEIKRSSIQKRLNAIAKMKSVPSALDLFDVWNLRGYAANLSTMLPALLDGVRGQSYGLIIVDPIYKVLGGRDENSAGEIGKLLNELEQLAMQSGAAVVFAAHYSKGNQAGKASIDRVSGSGVFARDPDTILTLTQHTEADAFTMEAILRDHPPVAPFVVRWNYPLMERDDDLDPKKLKQVAGRPKAHTTDDLLKALGEGEKTYRAWQVAAQSASISETTFKTLRKELIESGQVWKDENGTYRRTEKGGNTV